jgi:hypothetical protein
MIKQKIYIVHSSHGDFSSGYVERFEGAFSTAIAAGNYVSKITEYFEHCKLLKCPIENAPLNMNDYQQQSDWIDSLSQKEYLMFAEWNLLVMDAHNFGSCWSIEVELDDIPINKYNLI